MGNCQRATHRHPRPLSAPVGFVFLSLVNLGAGPINAFGRTFYLADGNNGTVNVLAKFIRMNNSINTGGSDTHTLTINEMPSHGHTANYAIEGTGTKYAEVCDSGSGSVDTIVNPTGGGAAHNNMPAYQELYPYQAVN